MSKSGHFLSALRGPRSPVGALVLCGIAMIVLIFAARLCYFAEFGSALPFWDQWDGEGWSLYRPMMLGTFDLQTLFEPHNEHRIVISRLVAAALFLANGEQWDVVPLILANGLLAGAIYTGFALYLLRKAAPPIGLPLAVLTLVSAVLCHGWENFLQGFQTAFFALLAATLAGIVWAAGARMRWHQPLVCGLLALVAVFSLGSGLLVAPLFGFVLLLRWRDQDSAGRRWLISTVALLAAVTLLALYMRVRTAPLPFPLSAKLDAIAVLLSWPFPNLNIFSLLPWTFTALGLWRVVRGTDRRTCSLVMAGVAGWVLLQIFAMAMVRGNGMVEVPSRYTDIVIFGLIANVYFALDFFVGRPRRTPALRFTFGIFVALGVCEIVALGVRTGTSLIMMRARSVEFAAQRLNVSAYLVTGDESFMRDKPMFDLPHPVPARLKHYLDDPTIRKILHRHVFATPKQPLSAALYEDAGIGPVSYAGRVLLVYRMQIAAAALLLLVLAYARYVWTMPRDEPAPG